MSALRKLSNGRSVCPNCGLSHSSATKAFGCCSSNVTTMTPRGHRTPEQIRAQLKARFAEMEREAGSPAKQFPCRSCRWWRDSIYEHCTNTLVTGFNKPDWCWDKHAGMNASYLCGPEKALWEPKRNIIQRIFDWFISPWIGG